MVIKTLEIISILCRWFNFSESIIIIIINNNNNNNNNNN